jgi:hypothetical protein
MNLGIARLRGRPRNRWQDEVREDGRSSWERQGIVAFCTCQWNEWIRFFLQWVFGFPGIIFLHSCGNPIFALLNVLAETINSSFIYAPGQLIHIHHFVFWFRVYKCLPSGGGFLQQLQVFPFFLSIFSISFLTRWILRSCALGLVLHVTFVQLTLTCIGINSLLKGDSL